MKYKWAPLVPLYWAEVTGWLMAIVLLIGIVLAGDNSHVNGVLRTFGAFLLMGIFYWGTVCILSVRHRVCTQCGKGA